MTSGLTSRRLRAGEGLARPAGTTKVGQASRLPGRAKRGPGGANAAPFGAAGQAGRLPHVPGAISTIVVIPRCTRRHLAVVAALLLGVSLVCAAPIGAAQVRTNAFVFVDLSRHAAAVSFGTPSARPLGGPPAGVQAFHGVPFLIRDRVAVTGLEAARQGQFYPTELTAIPVGRKTKRLHLLHGAQGADKDGVPMAILVFHYAGGAEESVRLGYGIHARNWEIGRLEKKQALADPNSQVAWAESGNDGRGPESRLFQTALENPRPGEVITSLDVISLFSQAAPFIAAISAETGESGLAPNRPLTSRKVVRELNEFGDSTYRRELAVRVTDAAGGGPLTNATVALEVTDDEESFYFGEARAGAHGICRLAYPPQQTVAFNLLVRAPNRIPQVLSEAKASRAGLSREFTASLQRGVTVGGVVKASDGQPVAGAEVAVYKITKTSPREYTRIDHDTARTDAGGKWTSSSVPAGFEGFRFEVTHPNYRPAIYAMPGALDVSAETTFSSSGPVRIERLENGATVMIQEDGSGRIRRTLMPRAAARPTRVPEVTSNALLAATAEMTLSPAILVSGVVLDSEGQPAADTEVIFQRNSPAYERKHLMTDAQGRFRVMAAEPGDGALIVVRSGQSPQYRSLSIEPNASPIEIKLRPARVLRGRVLDRQQRPVPGAKVRLDEWQGTTDLLRFQAITDEQGRFTWTGAPTDQVMLYVSATNHYTMRHSMSGNSDELTLYLNRQPGVSGKVYDAETRKPIDLFNVIKGRKYSPNEPRIRWERYDTGRFRNGEYVLRLDDYYFQPEARIMVEAPGYVPQISRGFQSADSYTNDFALTKGQGLSGIAQTADGAPAANATVLLVDNDESGYMDSPGQFRSNNSGGDSTRADTKGRFEFSPKLEAEWILVAHEQGFAEVRADKLASNNRIVLQPWARVKGVMRVGDTPEPDQTVRLQNRYDRFYEPGNRSSGLSLYLKAEPDEAGNFVFEKVPPGRRQIYVEYRFKERQYGETPLSHGLPLAVEPGATLDVMLGGAGRKVVGRVKVIGGDVTDVDWRRDVHKLTLILPPEPSLQQPDVSKATTPEVQQRAWQEFNQRQREFSRSAAGRARELAERTYVLVFDTNGGFRVDNVAPGKYMLSITANDPEEEYYRQRMIGSVNKQIEVPDVAGAKVNEPFDLGTLDMTIRGKLKIGKPAPPLETKTVDGKPISLSDYRGKLVLLYFYMSQMSAGSFDFKVLKELQDSYGKEEKLVILGLSLDANPQAAEQCWPPATCAAVPCAPPCAMR